MENLNLLKLSKEFTPAQVQETDFSVFRVIQRGLRAVEKSFFGDTPVEDLYCSIAVPFNGEGKLIYDSDSKSFKISYYAGNTVDLSDAHCFLGIPCDIREKHGLEYLLRYSDIDYDGLKKWYDKRSRMLSDVLLKANLDFELTIV